ncbi:MAG: polysaccharide deacetylase family protein, partial [Clostridium butyricum]|nr:polysaccharide deacetylase family protein [Clostridium butyricum]
MDNKKKCKNTLSKRLKKNRRRKKLVRSFVLIILIGIGLNIYIYNHKASIKVDSNQYEASNEYNYETKKFEDKINSENISNSPVENLKTDVDNFEKVDITNENKGVPVLCYHSIGYDESGKSPLIVSPQKFKEHMKALKDNG